MAIHNFVDNIVNTTTLFVNSATPPSSKVFLHSFSFLLFEKGTTQPSLTSNLAHFYNSSDASLLTNFSATTNQLRLSSTSIYVGPFNLATFSSYSYGFDTVYLNTSFGKFTTTFKEGSAFRTARDEISIFVKNAQDQELTWFVSTNLLEHTEVEIVDTPDDNGGGQPTTGLKEFWA